MATINNKDFGSGSEDAAAQSDWQATMVEQPVDHATPPHDTNDGDTTVDGGMPLPENIINQPLGSGTIVGYIGSGGMGDVYKIWNENINRHHAVKLIKQGFDRRLEKRFEREIKITATFDHPNIIYVHGAGKWKGYLFLEMEFVKGNSLDRLLQQRGCFSPVVCIAAGILTARALYYAHNHTYLLDGKMCKGVIHRDLKPSNIMLANDGRLKLMDFGIARPVGGEVATLTEDIVGSLVYLPPEQVDGCAIDHRADIYALGEVLYEMLAGKPPFRFESLIMFQTCKLQGKYDAVTEGGRSVPAHLVRIIDKCLKVKPEARFQSALELENDLKKLFIQLTDLTPETAMELFVKGKQVDAHAYLAGHRRRSAIGNEVAGRAKTLVERGRRIGEEVVSHVSKVPGVFARTISCLTVTIAGLIARIGVIVKTAGTITVGFTDQIVKIVTGGMRTIIGGIRRIGHGFEGVVARIAKRITAVAKFINCQLARPREAVVGGNTSHAGKGPGSTAIIIGVAVAAFLLTAICIFMYRYRSYATVNHNAVVPSGTIGIAEDKRDPPAVSAPVSPIQTDTLAAGKETVAENPPGIPDLIAPPDSQTTTALDIVFIWKSVPDVDFYRFQIAVDNNFEQTIFDSSGCRDTLLAMIFAPQSIACFWRVLACNKTAGAWSPAFSLFIENTSPRDTTLRDSSAGLKKKKYGDIAVTALEGGRLTAAEAAIVHMASDIPQKDTLLIRLAEKYLDVGNIEKAENLIGKTTLHDMLANVVRGRILLSRGDCIPALNVFRAAVASPAGAAPLSITAKAVYLHAVAAQCVYEHDKNQSTGRTAYYAWNKVMELYVKNPSDYRYKEASTHKSRVYYEMLKPPTDSAYRKQKRKK